MYLNDTRKASEFSNDVYRVICANIITLKRYHQQIILYQRYSIHKDAQCNIYLICMCRTIYSSSPLMPIPLLATLEMVDLTL